MRNSSAHAISAEIAGQLGGSCDAHLAMICAGRAVERDGLPPTRVPAQQLLVTAIIDPDIAGTATRRAAHAARDHGRVAGHAATGW